MCEGNMEVREGASVVAEEIEVDQQTQHDETSSSSEETDEMFSRESSEDFHRVVQLFRINEIIYGPSYPNLNNKKRPTLT